MEKLVRVNSGKIWKVATFIAAMWAIFLGCNYLLEDPLLFVLFGTLAICCLPELYGVMVLSPKRIEKDEEGYYKIKFLFIDHYISQDDLTFEEDGSGVYMYFGRKMDKFGFFFDEEKIQEHKISYIRIILQMFGLSYGSTYTYLVGRDYIYVGDGDPQDFFKDSRPPKEKKPPEPKLEEVPPEKDNPYGIELPEE